MEEPDLNAVLRCLSLNEEGSVAERRYRLVRFHLRRQLHSNVSWNAVDDGPVPGHSSMANYSASRPNIVNYTASRTQRTRPFQPISSRVNLSTNTQWLLAGYPGPILQPRWRLILPCPPLPLVRRYILRSLIIDKPGREITSIREISPFEGW